MRALKVLVVVMGVLLVLGTVGLVVAVVKRADRPRPPAAAIVAAAPAASHVDLPAGARIAATELAGDRLLVRIVLASGDEEMMLFDARTGARVATIDLHLGAAAAESR